MSYFYVYILQSESDDSRFYAGLTDNLRARLKKHNKGDVPHTSKFGPWKIKTAIAFTDRSMPANLRITLKLPLAVRSQRNVFDFRSPLRCELRMPGRLSHPGHGGYFSSTKVPSRRKRIFCPRHSTVFPKTRRTRPPHAADPSPAPASAAGDDRPVGMNRRWRFWAMHDPEQNATHCGQRTRTRSVIKPARRPATAAARSVALDKMLKK